MARLGRSSFEQSRRTRDLAVPWEEKLPPEKRRFDVRFIRGGPGKSGMGIVYLVYDREHDFPYAIKTFQDRFLGSSRAVGNFKKEAQIWVELGKHKNIVKAIGVEINLGRPYIFLEMVAGDELYGADLSGWIRGKGLDLPLMLNLAIQFCRGMSHAEQRFNEMGRVFVHRDIKPENIMVTRDRVVKVTDFGLVHAVRDEVFDPESIDDEVYSRFSVMSQQGICGTPFYMSPEQVLQGTDRLKQLGIVNTTLDVPSLDLRSDMYAFGCVLYEMITGQPPFRKFPFDRRDYARYFSQTLYDEPETVASGDKEFDDLTMRLLRKSPEKRGYRSFAELEEALQGIHTRLTGERLKEEHIEEIEAWELVNRGASFGSLGQFEQSMREYDQALTLKPGLAEIYYNRGYAYVQLKQFERALTEYDQALTLRPGYVNAYLNRGIVYTRLEQYEQALADFNQTLTLNSQNAYAYLNRGYAYVQLKQLELALADFNKTLTLNPRDAEAYTCRGNVYIDLGEFDLALADFDRAITLKPGLADAYYGRAGAYAVLGQAKWALADFDKVIELKPELVEVYYNRGIAYANLGQYERALADFNQAIALNPEYANAYYNRGNAYAYLGQVEQAMAEYDKAIELNPGLAEAYINRGNAYAQLGQYEQALADLRRFIELAPAQYAQHIATVKEGIRQLEAQIRGR